MSKRSLLRALALLVSTVPALICTAAYFPVWSVRGEAAVLSGLGLILGRYAEVKKVGGDMVVLNPSKNVMKILKLAGADRMIKIEKLDLGDKKRS